jgi:hypothetical protein
MIYTCKIVFSVFFVSTYKGIKIDWILSFISFYINDIIEVPSFFGLWITLTLYTISRIVYCFAYYFEKQPLRSTSYLISVIALLCLGVWSLGVLFRLYRETYLVSITSVSLAVLYLIEICRYHSWIIRSYNIHRYKWQSSFSSKNKTYIYL